MPLLSMAHMYQTVRDMYDSPKWREKVLHMSDNQIMAIYFDRQERDQARLSKRKEGKKCCCGKPCGRVVESVEHVASCTDEQIPEQLSFFD